MIGVTRCIALSVIKLSEIIEQIDVDVTNYWNKIERSASPRIQLDIERIIQMPDTSMKPARSP